MLGTKLAFSTAYHPQTDGLAERIIQTMEEIIRRFCAYGMEYKDHEGEITPTGGKRMESLTACGSLEKNILTIHPTSKDFHDMWKKTCDTTARCTDEEKEYKNQRYDKTHKEPDFKEGDQVLVSILNFNNLKVQKKMRDSFVGPFTIIGLIGKNAVEVKLTEEFSRKYPFFPNPKPQDIVEVEDYPGPVKKIIKARKIRLNGKDHRQYLTRFKNQRADEDEWLAEDAIPDGDLYLIRFRAPRRAEKSHQ
ncbi:hypothetical protein O181_133763 [Austropuccinia psidii MF-1]|uniref:Integrase catalytic domain-containing protein n=1 Tax=Austropuccinia psidii MF-1 TaxID=1389203 RepID=A0A9Q3QCV9_9BASI|nr:hypothetical protein [Austropuccinia psidii MF-1]